MMLLAHNKRRACAGHRVERDHDWACMCTRDCHTGGTLTHGNSGNRLLCTVYICVRFYCRCIWELWRGVGGRNVSAIQCAHTDRHTDTHTHTHTRETRVRSLADSLHVCLYERMVCAYQLCARVRMCVCVCVSTYRSEVKTQASRGILRVEAEKAWTSAAQRPHTPLTVFRLAGL